MPTRRSEDAIQDLFEILWEENIKLPTKLIDLEVLKDRLDDFFENLTEIAYENGRYECCDGECG